MPANQRIAAMGKLVRILLVSMAVGGTGCAQPATTPWHQRIAPAPTTQPAAAAEPETGEAPWTVAGRQYPRPLSRVSAFQVLLNTDAFADAYVGYGGKRSVQVEAFNVLLDRPDAKEVFSDLMERAKTAGKLYALCAFYLIAPEKYPAAEQQVLRQEGEVEQWSFCIVSSRPVREIVRCPDPNTVRLRRGETVKQWFERVQPPGGGAMYDISGGAIPETFRDAR